MNMNAQTTICQNCQQQFTIEPEDFDFYAQVKVPPPTWCYLCRAQRRFMFRNERPLYKRQSDLSGTTIFATYPATVPFPVYSREEWMSDAWDPLAYGQDYDFSRPFFEQFRELSDKVPKPSKSATGFLVNSDYSNNCTDLKNCYLIFNASYDEDCAYGNATNHSKECYDNSNLNYGEFCYETFASNHCNRVFFSKSIEEGHDIFFSKNLRGCSYCFGCANLRNQSYCMWNEHLGKEEYLRRFKEYDLGSYATLRKLIPKAHAAWLTFPARFAEQDSKSTNVTGEYIYQAKNVKITYQNIGGEHLKYCQYLHYPPTKDCYDFTVFGEAAELSYECAMVGDQVHNAKFTFQTFTNIRDVEYCEYCISSANLFGCVSVRNRQYCILNKQYTKEEYEALVPKIKAHMDAMPYIDGRGRVYRYGEFFPPEFAPLGYNETIAQEHFPLSKDQALAQRYKWTDMEPKDNNPTLSAADLADHIKDTPESILQETIGCEHQGACSHNCSKAFRIIEPELSFYRRFGLALPRLCVNCRHWERLKQRNSMQLWHRRCMCDYNVFKNNTAHAHHPDGQCPNEFETSYAPERPEIVYCEPCFQAETA